MNKLLRLSAYVSFLLASVLAGAQTRLAVPSYQDPGSPEWNAWAAPGSKSVGIMIVNQNNGDDTHYYPTIAAGIRDARAQGIFVVAYVYTHYGQRDPILIRTLVDAVYKNYQEVAQNRAVRIGGNRLKTRHRSGC